VGGASQNNKVMYGYFAISCTKYCKLKIGFNDGG